MKFSFVHQKTLVLPVNGQQILVANLPEELRNEVDTLDRLLQDKLEAIYRLETLELAVLVKLQQITQQAAAAVNKANETQVANQKAIAEELNKQENETVTTKKKK